MPNGYTVDQALQQIREVTVRVGREPSTGDMGGNIGAYVRLFGSWETAKEIAGVKGYIAPEKDKPPIPTRAYNYVLTPEEMSAEREAYRARCLARAQKEAVHERRGFSFSPPNIGKRFEKKLRENEYLPPRDALMEVVHAYRVRHRA